MPIAVMCPSCSASFKVKDEYAGKRAKCPKCGEPITIPAAVGPADTVRMPPGAFPARPVVASKPKAAPLPLDDEADEPVSPKRKRGASSDDKDDGPKSKRRKVVDEEEADDTPKKKRRGDDEDVAPKSKRRRRDDDDDKPKKKGSALPLILGIVGGVILLCGGGCGGIYIFVLKPASDNLQALGSSRMSAFDSPKPTEPTDPGSDTPANSGTGGEKKATRETMNKLRVGMTLAQVEDTVGKGKAADDFDLLRGIQGNAGDAQWQAKQKANAVYSFGGGVSDVLLVAFTTPPANGGTLVGVRGGFGADTFEPIKLPGGGGGTPSTPTTNTPDGVIPANLLVSGNSKEYVGKQVTVRGKVREISTDSVTLHTPKGLGCICTFGSAELKKMKLAERDVVEITGAVQFANDLSANLDKCKLLKRTEGPSPYTPAELTATQLIEAYMADPVAADAKYGGEQVKITGVVQEDGRLFYLKGKVEKGSRHSVVVTPNFKNKVWQTAKPGDTVTVVATVASYGRSGMHTELLVFEAAATK